MPHSTAPAVSVIVPTHNRPGMLAIALESLARQSFRDFEALVVNDAGEDVAAVVGTFAPRMAVRLITHERNKGLAASRNTGLAAARGKYIAYLDDDDYYLEHHLAALHAFLRHSEYRVAYTDARRDVQEPQDGAYTTVAADHPYSINFFRPRLHKGNITPVLCVMHERACLERSGLFAEYLKAHEDWDLWMRMARHYDFAHIPKVTCAFTWRMDRSSLSSGKKDLMRDTWVFTRTQGLLADLLPSVAELEKNAATPTRLGAEKPASCMVSVILPLAAVDAQTPRALAALCATLGDAQLVLAGSNLGPEALAPLLDTLSAILKTPPLAVCNAAETGRLFAANQGGAAATGEWLVFLEEEAKPQPGWLEALLRTAAERPDLGALGGVMNLPGHAPFAGGAMNEQGIPAYAPLPPLPSFPEGAADFVPAQLVSSHCLMLRREIFAAVGGFDPAFAPGHYADADLCLRLEQMGLKNGIARQARLTWNAEAWPLVQTPAGVLLLRLFQDRWAAENRTTAPDTRGADWSWRSRPWPADGIMPESFEMDIPGHLV